MLASWESTPNKKPSIKTRHSRGKWPEKIKSLSTQLAKLTREKNYYTKKRKTEYISTKRTINRNRKKLYKLLSKFKEEEKKKYYSTIEKTSPLARIGKIFENNNTELGVLTKNDGTTTTNPKETLEHLADELLGKEEINKQEKVTKQRKYTNEINNLQINQFINENRLKLAINELKKNKAAGYDNIFNEIIIVSYDTIKEQLLKLMKASIQYNHTPKIWQKNKSAIIAKPGKEE